MKTIEIEGVKYAFSPEQLEAAKVKVVDKFDFVMEITESRKFYEGLSIFNNIRLTFPEYLQARCLSLWNKRAIESNGEEKMDFFTDQQPSGVDWKDASQFKYSPRYDGTNGSVKYDYYCAQKYFIGEHHLGKTKCEQAIEYFGESFMKCLLGVNS